LVGGENIEKNTAKLPAQRQLGFADSVGLDLRILLQRKPKTLYNIDIMILTPRNGIA